MDIENFQPESTALKTGINLIEASAGTGKTYTIALLVLRFIVEKNIKIEQLLVVTFTKAATEELKDRIRLRLAEAKRLTEGREKNSALNEWWEGLSANDKLSAKARLDTALLNIDQAGIFTIHGFCQRVLTEYALESGQLFKFELTTDSLTIKQSCADDYWRKQLYPRTALQVSLLTAYYQTPSELLASVATVSSSADVIPKGGNLEALLTHCEQLINQAESQFESIYKTLTQAFQDEKFKKSYVKIFETLAKTLHSWLKGEALALPEIDALDLFSDQMIYQALNGAKFRKTKLQSTDERKAEYIATLTIENSAFNELFDAINQVSLHFRLGLVNDLQTRLDVYLQPLNQLTFDDLITHLSTAIRHDKQKQLINLLRQRFQVALIDEFQDTDEQQWQIFSALFAESAHFMYLIGDPKQAIYKFRGADIFSYFTAKDQAQHPFTLARNWRSHPNLVNAVNRLFSRKEAFVFEKLSFYNVDPALETSAGEIYYQQEICAPMMLWQLGESDSNTGDWTSGKAAKVIKIAVVNEVVDLLTNDYFLKQKAEKIKIAPKAIAILVRSNQQASDYQLALQQRGVPAVINSTQSVFASPQAFELYQLLEAVALITDISRLKQALALDWFGLQGQSFYALMNNEIELDGWVSRFNDYHLLWQQHGLMVMMSRLLAHERVYQHLSTHPLAERSLSNLNHLIELVQQVEMEQTLGVHKTLDYLAHAIQQAEHGSSEEQQLRLESDDDAVKIVTMHRSKGLEYQIVFCPFLWQSNERLKQEKELINCHTSGRMITDLGSSKFEKHKLMALNEQLAEDLRILYVAVTRAKYRCYMTWANVRSKQSPNNSALAYLMDFDDDNFEAQQQKLQHLKHEQDEVFDYALLDREAVLSGFYNENSPMIDFKVKLRKRSLNNSWQLSSYTALATLTKTEHFDTNESETENDINKPDTPLILALPRGAHTGNVIHSLLEFNYFKNLADPERDMSEQRDKTCLRYGLTIAQPDVINQLLQAVVSTPLSLTDEEFCLKNLKPWQCIKEMPFYLAVNVFNVTEINKHLKSCLSYQPLNSKQLEGYLTGFIDLICEYDGRYYVMDYKTNYLANYEEVSLIDAMREHNYGLQYWLYSVVLHLYLQARLPHYNYQQHFGGVRYLFVRGMIAEEPLSGVYETLPDLETLNALAAVFDRD
ncbi:MAG: exodeoxyribonuclease V subunit beta [Methylococcales bacterium]|nr:exodeoxyribonuclease V subunit beta [Methylococcales bacterium]